MELQELQSVLDDHILAMILQPTVLYEMAMEVHVMVLSLIDEGCRCTGGSASSRLTFRLD